MDEGREGEIEGEGEVERQEVKREGRGIERRGGQDERQPDKKRKALFLQQLRPFSAHLNL